MSTITSTNPYTGEIHGQFERHTNEQLDTYIDTAHAAYIDWKETSLEHRSTLFHKLADLIDSRNAQLALLETKEMGRLYTTAKTGLKSTANLMRRYADNVERVLGDQPFDHGYINGIYSYDPLGVIYGVGAWNFPFNQVLRAAAANIIAGNTTVYKHASNVPMCAQAIEDLFRDAGFPAGVYTNIYISGSQSEHIIKHRHIRGVNLTGSEAAGSAVASLAGKYLKPSVMELGGNDAFVLLDHTDTDAMAAQATACRISNGGQRCNASKRFIILEKHYDQFVETFAAHMATQTVGDPMDPSTQIPPMSSSKLINEIHRQVTATVSEGARLVTGGTIIDPARNLYAPTVLADVTPEMTSYQEEVFGPVASVIKSKSVEESIHIANNSTFGLSAVVFGDNVNQCKEVATQLEGGMIFVNEPAGSKASLPFGGVKNSGYGKENGDDGLRAFTNKKAIVHEIV